MKPLIFNLKMNHSLQEMIAYKKELEKESLANLSIAPATCYLPLMHSPHYDLISQYVSPREKNKVTGGTSAEALKSLDVKGVLINHFESRTRPDEVESQIKECLENNLKVYLIITGTLEEYYYQYTSEVLMMHLQVFLKDVSPKYYSKIVVIYEPSFLIGEEKALPINELNNIFKELRLKMNDYFHYTFPLYYGGGLSRSNMKSYLEDENIDGLLIGSFANKISNLCQLKEIRHD
uniref:triose-phosphate isomerase n=1 Tax=Candidatus Ventrenecus sp. TaxID=3085654 RepID=UPI004029C048